MLSGNVEMNGIVIGEWTATRRNPDSKPDQFNDYWCTLWYRGLDGYIYEADWEIWAVGHRNGAISLAARVLFEGMNKAKKRIPNTEDEFATEIL